MSAKEQVEIIDRVLGYLNEELESYIELCGEDDDVCVEPHRAIMADLKKVRDSLSK